MGFEHEKGTSRRKFMQYLAMLGVGGRTLLRSSNARAKRRPMDNTSRAHFATHYLPGIVLLVVSYFFLTAYRDFRDNYAVEILSDLGYAYEGNATLITRAETMSARFSARSSIEAFANGRYQLGASVRILGSFAALSSMPSPTMIRICVDMYASISSLSTDDV